MIGTLFLWDRSIMQNFHILVRQGVVAHFAESSTDSKDSSEAALMDIQFTRGFVQLDLQGTL